MRSVFLLAFLVIGAHEPALAQGATNATTPQGEPLIGTIHVWGSPQMRDLLRRYEAGFRHVAPQVKFEESLKSTVSAVAGVYTGRAEIGLLGREIWPSETEAFRSVSGDRPGLVEVATGSYDVPKATFALMIFVQRNNPLASLTTAQLARVFGSSSDTTDRPLISWEDLGLTGAWSQQPIHLYGFAIENDKAQIFSDIIFHGLRRWSCALHEYTNAAAPERTDAGEGILRALARDPLGIAISNVHYTNDNVRVIAVSRGRGQPAVLPTRETVASRSYPLSRAVYMVFNPRRQGTGSRLTRAFLRYVLSPDGAKDVLKEGNYLPLPPQLAVDQLKIAAEP